MDEQQNNMGTVPPVAPMQNQVPAQAPVAQHGSMGPVIGAIVVIAILAVGGLYYWGAELRKTEMNMSNEQEYAPVEADESAPTAQELLDVSTSDEISDIQTDLEASNFDALDAELEGDLSL
jgi:uncharacterized protein HemX